VQSVAAVAAGNLFRSRQDESKLVYSTAFDYHDYAHANVFGALDAEEQGEP
jgi:hypothetical protein